MNDINQRPLAGVGGWLLVLCALLLVWGPISFGLVAANALAALSVRGLSLAVVIAVRMVVTAVGIAAAIALIAQRGPAVTLAKVAIVLSAATDVVVYATPSFPNNRMPGDTPFYVGASLAYHGIWLAYLFRSNRVQNTYG
jgi:hypothetical protein